jgi:hypothetical protein
VVVGDLLLSGNERTGIVPTIPMLGDVTEVFPIGSGYSIVGLRQKVNVIAENCAIAWAGSQLGARIVIKELRALSLEKPLTYVTIKNYFDNLSADVLNLGISFVGWIYDGKGFNQFAFDYQRTTTPLFGEMCVAGTGAQPFCDLAMMLPANLPSQGREATALEKAISASLMAFGMMLQSEALTQQNLLQFFGGGYEIAAFYKDKFQKIGDICFVFWMAQYGHSRINLGAPFLALKQDYFEDILLIRTARINSGQDDTHPLNIDESLHAVSPVYRAAPEDIYEKIKAMDMLSRFTCHCILVQSEGSPQVLTIIEYHANRDRTSILFSENRLSINSAFVHRLATSIQRQYQLNTNRS